MKQKNEAASKTLKNQMISLCLLDLFRDSLSKQCKEQAANTLYF
jgi:hypothetical protein